MRLIIFTLFFIFAFGNLDVEEQQLKKTNVVLNELNEALQEAMLGDSKRPISQNTADLNSDLKQQNRALKKALERLESQNEESVGAPADITGGKLTPGQKIKTNQKLMSSNQRCYLKMQTDGNLVLYRAFDKKSFWSTQTNGNGNGYNAYFQTDGHFLVSKGTSNSVKWSSGSYNQGANKLLLQDDGNIVVYKNNQVLWTTNTHDRRACVSSAFDIVMASDPQYGYSECKSNPSTGWANYALADQNWCKSRNDHWRTNNLMNGIWDSLEEERKLTGKPIGANILGDLTHTASDGQEKAFARKVYDIEHDNDGPYRIWQSMGNHDLAKDFMSYKEMRHMVGNARNLVKNSGPGSYHDKGSFDKWHDGFCGDYASASYVYKKNGVAFINVQLAPSARYVRVYPNDNDGALNGPSQWLMDLLDGKNSHCMSFHDVKGVFLMYHYPYFCDGNSDRWRPPTDCKRWKNDVYPAIERFNNDPSKPRVMASFHGHYHGSTGYNGAGELFSLPGKVYAFFCGGLEFDTYLDVEVYPEDEYYVIYANALDPNAGKPSDKHATGFTRRCINWQGKSHSGCTKWKFDGSICNHNPSNPSSCPIGDNPPI